MARGAVLEVYVRPGRAPGLADLSDDLAPSNALAREHVDRPAMAVERDRSVRVDDDQQIAVTRHRVVAVRDEAALGCADQRTFRCCDVEASMTPMPFARWQ